MIKSFRSSGLRWAFIMLMFLPLIFSCVLGMGYFGYQRRYDSLMFLSWILAYIVFWMFMGFIIHISANDLFLRKSDFIIVVPTIGDPKVVLSGGHEYKKVGSSRPQSYTICNSKKKDFDLTTGIVYSAEPTDASLELHEIDIIDQIGNIVYMRGYFQHDQTTNTFFNNLDTTSLSAQISLLSLELKTTLKAKEGAEKLYEMSESKLTKERMASLDRENIYTTLFAKNLEGSNIATGKFSGTTTALEQAKISAKVGSDKQVRALIDEKIQELKDSLLVQMSNKS